jgi:hypothetical protein
VFTRLRIPQLTGDAVADIRTIIEHFRNLEGKGVLAIDEAAITASQGIKFPATQVSSTDANTLDDYEEGSVTFTDTSGATLSLTTNAGKYTKIGRHVFVTGKITYPVTASGAVSMIGGLPFTSASASDCSGSLGTTGAAVAGSWILLPASATSFNPEPANGGGLTNAQLSTATLWIGLHYIT